MAALTAGAIVLVRFPFSDLSRSKLRPAAVLADAGRDDWILCQITSNPYSDTSAIQLTDESFASGSLQRVSYARPAKLFTAHSSLISGQVGVLTASTLQALIDGVTQILEPATAVEDAESPGSDTGAAQGSDEASPDSGERSNQGT